MSQEFKSTEGIILRVIPFRDYDQILTLFTPEVGIMKLLYKGARSKRRSAQGVCMPLIKVEVVYLEKRGEIFSCHELSCTDSLTFLRSKLLHLEVGCELLHIILASQWIGKAAPLLYALLCFYLEKIPMILNPKILAASFRLKLLKHEGLVPFPFVCCECQQPLQKVAYMRGAEGWCHEHLPVRSQVWGEAELQSMYRLALCQNYREISLDDISCELQNKIINFFENCIKR